MDASIILLMIKIAFYQIQVVVYHAQTVLILLIKIKINAISQLKVPTKDANQEQKHVILIILLKTHVMPKIIVFTNIIHAIQLRMMIIAKRKLMENVL